MKYIESLVALWTAPEIALRMHWVGRAMGNKIFHGDGHMSNKTGLESLSSSRAPLCNYTQMQNVLRYVLVPCSSCLPVNDNLNSLPFSVTKRNRLDLFRRANGSKVTVHVIGLHDTLHHVKNWKLTVSRSCSGWRRKHKVRTSISFPSQHFQISVRSWNARAFLNEFLRTPWRFLGKQITYLNIYIFTFYCIILSTPPVTHFTFTLPSLST